MRVLWLEKVDPEERKLRLHKVAKATKKYRSASKLAKTYKHPSRKYGGGPTHLASMKSREYAHKAAHGEKIIAKFRPGRVGRKPKKPSERSRSFKRYYKNLTKDLTQRGYAPVRPSISKKEDADRFQRFKWKKPKSSPDQEARRKKSVERMKKYRTAKKAGKKEAMNVIVIPDFAEGMGKAKRSPNYQRIKSTLRKIRVHDKKPITTKNYEKHGRSRAAMAGSLKKHRPLDGVNTLKKSYHRTRGGHHASVAHWALNKAGEVRRKSGKRGGPTTYVGMGSSPKDLIKVSKRYSKMARKKGHRNRFYRDSFEGEHGIPESSIPVIVIPNFAEAVDAEERKLRLHKVAKFAKRQSGASKLAYGASKKAGGEWKGDSSQKTSGRSLKVRGDIHRASHHRAAQIVKKWQKPRHQRGPENRAIRLLGPAVKMGKSAQKKAHSGGEYPLAHRGYPDRAASAVAQGAHKKKKAAYRYVSDPVKSQWQHHMRKKTAKSESSIPVIVIPNFAEATSKSKAHRDYKKAHSDSRQPEGSPQWSRGHTAKVKLVKAKSNYRRPPVHAGSHSFWMKAAAASRKDVGKAKPGSKDRMGRRYAHKRMMSQAKDRRAVDKNTGRKLP